MRARRNSPPASRRIFNNEAAKLRQSSRLSLALLLAMSPTLLAAQPYPTRPVRVISPYPPGSSADVIGRIYAPRLTEALGKQFVVEIGRAHV